MNIVYHHRTRGEGAEGAHIRGIVHGLRELGHQVSIVSFPGADPERASNNSATPVRKEKKPGKGILSRLAEWTKQAPQFVFEWLELLYNFIAIYNLSKKVNQQQAALIYERYSLFMAAGIIVARLKRIPIILEINDSALVERVRPLYYSRIARYIEKWIVSRADGLVFISTKFKSILDDKYGNLPPSVVSPNGVDIDKFSPEHFEGPSLKKKLGLDSMVVCGYVGAFNPWHGLEWFIEMIVPRLKERPQLALLLLGDGISYDKILNTVNQYGVESQVCLPGRVEHSLVPEYIAAMDYAILPDSNIYGSPMKLFETMAMAKGMVVPDFPPIAEVVIDNQTSWLFKAGDRKACVDKVLMLSDKNEMLQQVGSNARQYVCDHRQWRHNAEQLLSLLEDSPGSKK